MKRCEMCSKRRKFLQQHRSVRNGWVFHQQINFLFKLRQKKIRKNNHAAHAKEIQEKVIQR